MATHPEPVNAPRGIWLGASIRLGFPVPIDQAYPHVCAVGAPRRDCAACAEGWERKSFGMDGGQPILADVPRNLDPNGRTAWMHY